MSVVICAVAGSVTYAYTPPSYKRTEKLMMKYDYFGKPTTPDLLAFQNISLIGQGIRFDNERHLLNSYVVWDAIVTKLKLNYEYREVDHWGRRTLLYKNSPIEVVFMPGHGEEQDRSVSCSVEKTSDNEVLLSDIVVGEEDSEVPDIIVGIGKPVETPLGRLAVYATPYFHDFDGRIDFKYFPKNELIPLYQSRLLQDVADLASIVIVNAIEDESKERAEDILNEIPVAYDLVWNLHVGKTAESLVRFIDDELASIGAELDATEKSMAGRMSAGRMVSIDASVNRLYKDDSEYESKLLDNELRMEIVKFLSRQLSEEKVGDGLLTYVGDNAVDSQVGEYNKLVLRRASLMSNGGSMANPEIRRLDSDLSAYRDNIGLSLSKFGRQLSIERDRIGKARLKVIGSLPGISEQEKKLVDLRRKIKIKDELVRYLLEKQELCKLTRTLDPHPVRVIMPAYGEDAPISPNFTIFLLVSVFVGFAVPVGFAAMQNAFDSNVCSIDDFAGYTYSVIGKIPQYGRISLKNRLMNFLHKEYKTDKKPRLLVNPASSDNMSSAFLGLSSTLEQITAGRQEKPVAIVTSFNPGSGKTFILLNLAAAIAMGNKKVLLVDLDIRRASLSEFVGSPRKGLVSYLSGESDLHDIIVRDRIRGVDIIPAFSQVPPNPVELLESDKLGFLVSELSHDYDWVLIDCPPVNIIADTSLAARLANRTLFVVRNGMLDKRMLQELEYIYRAGEYPRMSVIFNGVSTPPL